MEGKPGEAAATSSSTSSEAKGRSTPTAVEPPPSSSTAGTARKRDRDDQFGPTTPSGHDEAFGSLSKDDPASTSTTGSGNPHAAKKNRVLSRDGSFVTSKPGQDPFRSEQDEDLEQTPPGTPRVGAPGGEGSVPTSPRTAHANLASNIRDTPPGTPATTSRPLAGPETNKVKEMRERVQEMTTDEAELTNGSGNVSSSASVSAPSPPAQDVQEQIADLPESAAAAESEPEFRHQDGDVVIQEPEELPETPATAMPPPSSSTSRLPALTAPAIAALGRSSSLIPPPSPASSVRAETGSNAGDSDYLNNDFPVSARGGPSRMSSMSSMRSVTYSGGSLFHSALPRSSTGPETPSDALSDVSTDVAPPETPRPPVDAVDASTPSTPLLPSATAISRGPSAEVPPPYEPAEEASSSVQSARPQPTQSTPAKSFVNSFSSLGSSTSSPFASSSSSAFGAAANSKSSAFGSSSASSNLSTAKPIGGSGFGAFGGAGTASPFASGAGKTNALTRKGSEAVAAQEEDDAADENDVATKEGLERDENKIFSSSEEVTMVTGEEDEYTQYAVPRAKLFVMDGAEWKERGVGQLRLNTRNDPRDDKFSVRMVMRSEAVLRLILNIPLFSSMQVTLAQDKFIRFSAFEDGVLRHFTIRVGNSLQGKELHEQMMDVISMLPKVGNGTSPASKAAEV